VDPEGAFSWTVDAPAVGEVAIELRADVPQLASRTARVVVRRVARLADEARAREKAAWLGYDAIVADPTGSVGKDTVVEGDVLEARASGSAVIALIDDARGCKGGAGGGCLVRVVYAGDEKLTRGAHVRVYGKVTGTLAPAAGATGGSTAVPVVQAEFALKGRSGRH